MDNEKGNLDAFRVEFDLSQFKPTNNVKNLDEMCFTLKHNGGILADKIYLINGTYLSTKYTPA